MKASIELFDSALNEIFSAPNVQWRNAKLADITSKIGSGATKGGRNRIN